MSMVDNHNVRTVTVGPDWSWVRTRQLEGSDPRDRRSGVWSLNYLRVCRGWGQIPEWEAAPDGALPDASQHDNAAKNNCIDSYSRVWDFADCRLAFARNSAPSASFLVTKMWKNPPEGRLDFDQDHLPILGGHCLGMSPPLFYSPCPIEWEEDDFLVSRNSWGAKWGNNGWAAMTKWFFNRYMYSAWTIEQEVRIPQLYGSGVQHVEWTRGRFPDRMLHAYDVIDVDAQERIGWTLFVHRRGELHVEDLYVKPEHRGKGYGSRMMQTVLSLAARMQPARFWIDFADVDTPAKSEFMLKWFSRFKLRIERSPRPWAAYTATFGSPVTSLPAIDIPPKPAYVFAAPIRDRISEDRLEELRQLHGASLEFKDLVRETLKENAEVLQRLA